MSKSEIVVGHVGVDSGTILITDPCYIKEDYDYKQVVEPVYQNLWSHTLKGLGFITTSGYGDGYYPVYATVREDKDWGARVESITIRFMEGE
tara:strand:- start:673 stop:948 length:276 start_codon:yes stop_codon:yes gene_type:complete